MVEASRARRIHHHLVELLLWVLAFNLDGLVLEILRVGARAFELLLVLRCLRLVLSLLLLGVLLVASLVAFLAFAGHYTRKLDLFVLQDVSEDDTRHVGIVGSLVVVRKQGLTRIVTAAVLRIKLAPKVALEFVILRDLLVELAERSIVESFRVERQHFGIEGVREASVPLLSELQIGFRQRPNELVVQVYPVVHTVVPNYGLLCPDHGIDHQRETHLVSPQLLLSILRRDLLLGRRRRASLATIGSL